MFPSSVWSQAIDVTTQPVSVGLATLILLPLSLVLLIAYLRERSRVKQLQRSEGRLDETAIGDDDLSLHRAKIVEQSSSTSNRDALSQAQAAITLINARAIEIGNIGVWSFEISTGEFSWSDNIYRQFGLDPAIDNASGELFLSVLHPEDLDRIKIWTEQIVTGQVKPFEIEYRVVRPNGEIRFFRDYGDVSRDAQGRMVRVTGITQDVTDSREIEGLNERLSTTLDMTNDGIYMYEADTLRFFYVNQGAVNYTGYSREELLTMTPIDLNPDVDEVQVHEVIDPLTQADHKSDTFYGRHRCKDGSMVPVEFSIQYVDPPGEKPRFITVVRNVAERQKMEEELRRERNFTEGIIANAGSLIIVMDSQSRIVTFNRACEKLSQYSFEEIENGYIWDYLIPPEDLDRAKNTYESHVEGEIESAYPLTWVIKDGSRRTIMWSVTQLRDENGEVEFVVGVGNDITERQKLDQDLLENRRLFARAEAIGDVGSYGMDLKNQQATWSPQLLKILGLKTEGLVTTLDTLLTCVHADDRDRVKNAVMAALTDDRGRFEIEYRVVHADGSQRTVRDIGEFVHDQSGRAIHLTGTMRDVTEHVAAQRALKESEARFRLLASRAPVGIFTSDISGEIIFANEMAITLSGLSASEWAGSNWVSAVHPDDLDRTVSAWQDAIDGGSDLTLEFRYRHPNGMIQWVIGNSTPLRDLDDRIVGRIGTLVDLNERKRFEVDLILAKEEAEAASAAKSEFLSSMSHELRTPMNAILGFAQLLELDASLSASQSKSVTEIYGAGQHLMELISEVLDLSSIEAGNIQVSMENVELSDVLAECVKMANPLAIQHDVSVQLSGLDGLSLLMVKADRTRLIQVMINLISNGIKYNLSGGSVSITYGIQSNDTAVVTVSDTGPGIPEDKINELFEPFNRLGVETMGIQGTGIGLTISQRLIDAMGGHITVDSTIGVGTSFHVEIQRGTD